MENSISKKWWILSQVSISAVILLIYFFILNLFGGVAADGQGIFTTTLIVGFIVFVFGIVSDVIADTFPNSITIVTAAILLAIFVTAAIAVITSSATAIFWAIFGVALVTICGVPFLILWVISFIEKSNLSKCFIWTSWIIELMITAGAMNLVWLF